VDCSVGARNENLVSVKDRLDSEGKYVDEQMVKTSNEHQTLAERCAYYLGYGSILLYCHAVARITDDGLSNLSGINCWLVQSNRQTKKSRSLTRLQSH